MFINAGDELYGSDILTSVISDLKDKDTIVSGKVKLRYKKFHSITNCSPWVCHQSAFIPRSFFDERLYDEDLKFFGDLDFWLSLKKDGKFKIQRISQIICEFPLGGISNKPNLIFQRNRERIKLAKLYDGKIYYTLRMLRAILQFLIFKIFGRDIYYLLLIKGFM